MFDPRTELSNTNDSYDRWGDINHSARARKTAPNYENYGNWNGGGVNLRPQNMADESGVCSPPLWNTSPPRSPVHQRPHHNNYRYLSPASRTQAIARGQWELMEMVKKMPESSYELTLRDLVVQPRAEPQEDCLVQKKIFGDEVGVKVKRQESKRKERKVKMMNSRSTENGGLFLKMVFPVSLGSKKKKKNSGPNKCAKISPKPENLDKSSKGAEKDWWKKRFSVSGESENGGNSNNTGSKGSSGSSGSSRSNSTRKTSDISPGCWSGFFSKNSKSAN
ncbi:unnamed protein product [Ilex paraguariensis]|uniref:Uncharacterized protein n=1 Tax=Ilex paraguariensis TaxID=185542 RepID=A0ABC8V2Z5_9AQUA